MVAPHTMLKILRAHVSWGSNHNANNKFTNRGKQVTADITLMEIYLVKYKTIRKITVHIRTAPGWIASSAPQKVETPLPPRKWW